MSITKADMKKFWEIFKENFTQELAKALMEQVPVVGNPIVKVLEKWQESLEADKKTEDNILPEEVKEEIMQEYTSFKAYMDKFRGKSAVYCEMLRIYYFYGQALDEEKKDFVKSVFTETYDGYEDETEYLDTIQSYIGNYEVSWDEIIFLEDGMEIPLSYYADNPKCCINPIKNRELTEDCIDFVVNLNDLIAVHFEISEPTFWHYEIV